MSAKLHVFIHPFIKVQVHCWLSWSVLGLLSLHAILLLFDNYFTFSIPQLLVPFISEYEPIYVGLGVIAMYIIIIIIVSTRVFKNTSKEMVAIDP